MSRKKPVMVEVRDLLRAALDREREHRRIRRPPETDTSWAHVFRCVCCNRLRREEYRREPDSEVCVLCVAAAGQQI